MFSIIIPTYNRANILIHTLNKVFDMDVIEECEVIVVNDGSTDNTKDVLCKYEKEHKGNLKILTQSNQGPGIARNYGLKEAKHDLVLFLDDDVFPPANLLKEHSIFLQRGFDLSQGILVWHPEIALSPVLKYMDSKGMQFKFPNEQQNDLHPLYVYTANLAVKRSKILDCGGFDDDFAMARYAFEDTAFAYNCKKNGLKIGLNIKAWAYHYHPISEKELIKREYKVGFSYGVLQEKYPTLAKEMGLNKKMIFPKLQLKIIKWLWDIGILKLFFDFEISMRIKCRIAFLEGLLSYKESKRIKDGKDNV
ncbi:hypothetical protein JCM12298_19150 [Desulfothermus naphthae]